jgi:hypothetical protein
VTLDGLTRRITNARRWWGVPDFGSWQKTHDSITSSMEGLGGRRFSCWKNPYGTLLHIRETQYWKFPSYSVRFISYRMEDDWRRSPWQFQLDGYPKLPPECGIDPWRRSKSAATGNRSEAR